MYQASYYLYLLYSDPKLAILLVNSHKSKKNTIQATNNLPQENTIY